MVMSGKKLKILRESHNMTQKSLGTILNRAESTISMWERGEREMDQETLLKVSKLFNVSIDYLIGNSTEENNCKDIEDVDFKFALYGEVKNFTEEMKKELIEHVEFLRYKYKK